MYCQAFCTAGSYQIKNLSERLKSHYTVALHKDALHVEIPHHGSFGDVFLFAYGACVFWNVPREGVDMLLSAIREFEVDPIDEPEMDEFTFTICNTAKVAEDEIFLPNSDPLTKLAVSYGIAQSVKLSVFESAILRTFNSTRSIPLNLAKEGKIHLSRKEIRKNRLPRRFMSRHGERISTHLRKGCGPSLKWTRVPATCLRWRRFALRIGRIAFNESGRESMNQCWKSSCIRAAFHAPVTSLRHSSLMPNH